MKKGQAVEALKGVSFSFPERGMFFIVGNSGSGKSTLLNILGFLDTYDGGDLVIDGKSAKDFSEQERDEFRALNIGFVFQEFHIIEKYTIGKNVSLPLEIQQKEDNSELVRESLKKVGLEGFENRNITQISGGQKQRVAIARAIIKKPKIILADEPTGSLDSVNGIGVFNLLQELSKEKLVIIISHDIESAHRFADKIIELKDGRIVDIYDGDGGAEAVRFVVDKVSSSDVAQYNKLLGEGKKVVVAKRRESPAGSALANIHVAKKSAQSHTLPTASAVDTNDMLKQGFVSNTDSTEQKVNATILNRAQTTRKVRLPFRSVMSLSFFSVKSKWAKTFFTILISMFAVAFFGFADIISRFDSDNLLIQEMNRDDVAFVDVGLEKVHDMGIFKDYRTSTFSDEHIDKFSELGLKAYPCRELPHYIPSSIKHYRQTLPIDYHDMLFYSKDFKSYIECNDVSKLGLNIIAGRAPSQTDDGLYEVMITTYHMQIYEVLGFDNGVVSYDSVTDFDQIKDQSAVYLPTGLDHWHNFKIVGLVEVDTSEFDELAAIKTEVEYLSEEQQELVAKFCLAKPSLFGCLFTREGFHENFETLFSARRIQPTISSAEAAFISSWFSLTVMTDEVFSDSSAIFLKPGITSLSEVGDNQVIVSRRGFERLFPSLTFTDSNLLSVLQTNNIFGSTISMRGALLGKQERLFKRDFEIIGAWNYDWETYFVSPNVAQEMYTNEVISYKVPATTADARKNIVQSISNSGEFTVGDNVYRFFCKTSNYQQIRQINVFFTLFVNVFSILALVFCGFAIILTYTFISQSINLRKRDIGILRSLGARKTDVANIFIVEGVFIAGLEILLGALTCYLGYVALDHYFISQMGDVAQHYTLVSFGITQVLLMSAVTISAVALSLAIPVVRISNKQPVDTIRN